MSDATILEYVRDVQSHFERNEAGAFIAHIRGIVTERKNAGRAQFIEVLDVTGSIQVIFLRDSFPNEEEYKLCKQIKVGDVIGVVGPFALNNAKRLSIFPTKLPEVLGEDVAIPIGQADLPYRAAGVKMIQARIIKHLRQSLDRNRFVEIEPRYLSTSWAGNGLEPINAIFPGFGLPIYLNPSPLPQLFEVLIATGQRKLYTVGRCFTSSARDTKSSTEATVVFCLEHLENVRASNSIWDSALSNLLTLFEGTQTAPSGSEFKHDEVTLLDDQWPLSTPSNDGLIVQRCVQPVIPFRERATPATKLELASLSEYVRIILKTGSQQYILAECSKERRFGAIDVVCTSYHTEHILDLLSTAPFRSLRTSTFWND
ncbi:MAG: OB-fold nucleic acid binding domain-containing protein [Blastocatellia bacterium]